MAFLLAACSGTSLIGKDKTTTGIVVSHDTHIAQSGKHAFEKGGNAADAMAAMLVSGSVVMPSRVGLGAGGVCQILNPKIGRVETLDFLSVPMSFDRKIGTPSLLRGVYTLKSKYGIRPWQDAFPDAIEMAQKGVDVSPMLAQDILRISGLSAKWKNLKSKDKLKQSELAKTLRTISEQSNADILYSGELANRLVMQSDQIIQEDLKATKVEISDSIDVSRDKGKTFFANPTALMSADGYTIWNNLQSTKAQKKEEAQKQLEDLQNRIVKAEMSADGMSFITADENGLVVACSVSMGSPFGVKQLTDQGFYLSSPIHPKERGYVFFNAMQTNPQVKDVTYVVAGVGDYALADGLLFMNETQLKDDSKVKPDLQTQLTDLSCGAGYPNLSKTCDQKEGVLKIYVKQGLTK